MSASSEGNRQELQATKRQLELRSAVHLLRTDLARRNLHSYLAMAESGVPDPNAASPELAVLLERMDAPGADIAEVQGEIIQLIQRTVATLDAREQQQIKPGSAQQA